MIIALTGPSGSGKSLIETIIACNYGYSKVISYTTREPRSGEENHKDYHFINHEEFYRMRQENQFVEWDCFTGGRLYGSTRNSYVGNVVCVLTPYGIKQLKAKGLNLVVVYVSANLKTRAKRYMDRIPEVQISDLKEIYERSERDAKMFNGIENEADFVVENEYETDLYSSIKDLMNQITKLQNPMKTIYIDFDNTLVNTTKRIVDMYNEDYQFYGNFKKINPDEVRTYGFKECALATELDITRYFNSARFFDNNLELMPGAYDAISSLAKKYKIKIVSMGNSPNLKGKELWIKNNMPYAEFVGCNLASYEDKSHIDMSDSVFIDDTDKMLRTSNAQKKILYDPGIFDWDIIKEMKF